MPLGLLLIPAIILALAAGLAAGAVLGDGLLPAMPLIAVAAVLLVGQIVLLRPVLLGLDRIRRNVASMIDDEPPAAEVHTASPRVNALWRAITRLDRSHRSRRSGLENELMLAGAVLAALPDPLLVIDAKRRITRANGAASALFGDRLVGYDLAAAIRNPGVLAGADSVLRGGGERLVEFELTAPIARDFRARIERVESSDATALVALTDLTTLKRAEQMRADFVANASHELRTPLSTMIGFIETLLGPAADDAEARARFLPIMRQQAGRMANLVGNLLSLSRIELNEHLPPRETIALDPMLRALAETLALRAEARNMRIERDPGLAMVNVVGDEEELSQLFQNLIDNALKYGADGSVVTIAAAPSARLRNGVAIAVSDHGEGIALQHIPRLTERFYRIDLARSRAMGGTGLGLAIVKHIVNRHRGLMEIESEPGVGSRFTVHLPIANADLSGPVDLTVPDARAGLS